MDTKKQQMNIMHKMCQSELIEMQMRIERYLQDSERVQKFLDERSVAIADFISPAGRRRVDMIGLVDFERYMAQMSTIVTMARKFSIYLHLNGINKIVLNPTEMPMEMFGSQATLFQEFLQQSSSYADLYCENDSGSELLRGEQEQSRKPMDLGPVVSAIENNKTTTNMKVNVKQESDKFKFTYANPFRSHILPQKDLSHFTDGHIFSAFITFVKDFIDLEFFICEMHDYRKLFEISSSLDIKPIDKSSLSDVVFGVSQDKDNAVHGNQFTWRAVKHSGDTDGSRDSILLIDFGEIIQMTESYQTYSIPAVSREHPPLAIRCFLKGVCSLDDVMTTDRDKCKELLSSNLYKMAKFRVLYQESGVLHLAIFTETNKDSDETIAKTEGIIAREQKNLLNSSLQEEQDISETNKDLSISTFVERKPSVGPKPIIKPQIGDDLKVTVTHVNSPISFYGIIYDTVDDVGKVLFWSDNDLTPSNKMHSPPMLNDIVLAQNSKDKLWHRAEIIEILPNDQYRVFYIDLGNVYIVTFSALALCNSDTVHIPPQAVLFRIANLKLISAKATTNETCEDDEYGVNIISQKMKQATGSLVVIIYKQTIDVKVVDCRGKELIVQILDDLYDYIHSMLTNVGIVEAV